MAMPLRFGLAVGSRQEWEAISVAAITCCHCCVGKWNDVALVQSLSQVKGLLTIVVVVLDLIGRIESAAEIQILVLLEGCHGRFLGVGLSVVLAVWTWKISGAHHPRDRNRSSGFR
jgi:hypothetical protein